MQSAPPVALAVAAISASAENLPNEGATKLIDGNVNTKWLAFAATATLTADFGSAKTVTEYTLTSANDFANRDPKTWNLSGSNNGSSWTSIDTRAGVVFQYRHQTKKFTVTAPGSYRYYRLSITANASGGAATQLAEWTVYDAESYSVPNDAAEEAITAPERQLVIEVKVDWDRNGTFAHELSDISPFVEAVEVDRALAGATPSEVMLVEGASAAELSLVLGGDVEDSELSWVGVLSPYNGLSPFYNKDILGVEITYRVGVDTALGTIWYPQFVGNIRTITPNRKTNSVQITALDRVEKLRRPIFMTDWGVLDQQANTGYLNGQLMYGHWVIDHCLKSCRTSSSPYRWPEDEQLEYGHTQIFLSGNGGIAPNVGWVDGSWQNEFPPDDTPALTVYHDRGQAHPDSPEPTKRPQMFRAQRDWGFDHNLYWAADRDAVNDGYVHVLGFTLHTENYAGSQWFTTMADQPILEWHPSEYKTVYVMMGAGKVWIRVVQVTSSPGTWNGTKLDIPITGDYIRVVAEYDAVQQARLSIVDGASTGIQSVSLVNIGWSFHESTGLLRVTREVSLQDIMVGTHTYPLGITPTIPGESGVKAEYAAVLDTSLNRLSFLPPRMGKLAWDVITEVAAAEFGAVFWDEDGKFHFWSQDTILAKKDEVVRSLTLDDISDLNITVSTDSVRNFAAVTSKRARVQKAIVHEAQGPDEYIAQQVPGVNRTTMWLQNVVTPNSAQPPLYAHPKQTGSPALDNHPHWNDFVQHGVVLQHLEVDGWRNYSLTSPGTMGLWMYRGPQGQTILRYNEGYANPHRFAISEVWDNAVIPEGKSSAAFRWDGSKLNTFDDTVFNVTNEASIDRWGPQGIELSGDWYQEFYNVAGLVDTLLNRTSSPIPVTDDVTITGDPRLQLGDAIEIYDPEGMGEVLRLQILGIRRSFSRDGGLVDSLTVELVRPSGAGVWDSPQYGLWDDTFVWSD